MRKKADHNEPFRIVSEVDKGKESKYEISRERWNFYSKKLEVAPSPLHIDIELTNICNLSCVMCEIKKMRREKGMMSVEIFKDIIHEAELTGVDSIKLNLWGESILHKDLINMISYAKENSSLILQFNTNANLMNSKISEGFINSGLDRLTISMDGISSKTYEDIRRGGNFQKVMNNIETLLTMKDKSRSTIPHVTLQVIRMSKNKHEIEGFVRYWEGRVDRVSVTDISSSSFDKNILNLSLKGDRRKGRKPCEQLWQRLSILWDGKITACCGDFEGILKVGEFRKDRIVEIWHSKKLTEMRRKHKALDFEGMICKNCSGTVDYI